MASTVLVKDVLWRVSVLLADVAPQWQRFPENELVRWLIDGQTVIAKWMPSATARTDAIKLAPGTKQSIDAVPQANIVPGDGIALTAPLYGIQLLSVIRNMGADGATPGKAITKMDRTSLDDFDEDWHTKTGTSVVNFSYDERDPTTFYATPGVPATGGPFYAAIFWQVLPKVIPNTGTPGAELYSYVGGSTTQTITVADKFVDDLVNYCLARAELKDSKFAEESKSTMYGALFVSSLNAQVKTLIGVNPNIKHLPGGTEPA